MSKVQANANISASRCNPISRSKATQPIRIAVRNTGMASFTSEAFPMTAMSEKGVQVCALAASTIVPAAERTDKQSSISGLCARRELAATVPVEAPPLSAPLLELDLMLTDLRIRIAEDVREEGIAAEVDKLDAYLKANVPVSPALT